MYNNRRFLSLFGFLEGRHFLFLIDYIHIMNQWRHSENNCIYPKERFVRLNKIGYYSDSLIVCTIFTVRSSMFILVVINFHVGEITIFYTRNILHSLRKQLTLLSIEIYEIILLKRFSIEISLLVPLFLYVFVVLMGLFIFHIFSINLYCPFYLLLLLDVFKSYLLIMCLCRSSVWRSGFIHLKPILIIDL